MLIKTCIVHLVLVGLMVMGLPGWCCAAWAKGQVSDAMSQSTMSEMVGVEPADACHQVPAHDMQERSACKDMPSGSSSAPSLCSSCVRHVVAVSATSDVALPLPSLLPSGLLVWDRLTASSSLSVRPIRLSAATRDRPPREYPSSLRTLQVLLTV